MKHEKAYMDDVRWKMAEGNFLNSLDVSSTSSDIFK